MVVIKMQWGNRGKKDIELLKLQWYPHVRDLQESFHQHSDTHPSGSTPVALGSLGRIFIDKRFQTQSHRSIQDARMTRKLDQRIVQGSKVSIEVEVPTECRVKK